MADSEKNASISLNGDFAKDDNQKRSDNDSNRDLSPISSIGPDDEITWHYLTFETELPKPAFQTRPREPSQTSKQPPESPDLKKYTSPFLWSRRLKHFHAWFGCVSTSITAYTAGSYAAGADQIMREWNVSQPVFGLGVTMFTLGFGLAPMFLAPFSEINGRRPVFVVTGTLFCIFQLVCALTPTFAGMLTARFLIGCAASTFSTMIGGVISDFYHAEDRNWAMAIFAGGAIGGTGLGPLCSGFIAQHVNWRWIFRVQVITSGLLMVVILFFFRESRGSVLLSRKAKALNRYYEELEAAGYYGVLMPADGSSSPVSINTTASPQRIRWRVKSDEERSSLLKMISISLYRPFHLLVSEPVVLFFSLWITFAWSVLYLLFSAIPLIFQTRYGFNVAQSGAIFAAVLIAAIISAVISIYQEPLARRYVKNERLLNFFGTPEGRLSFCCVQSSLLPIGCFWFGWTCFSDIPWIVPTLGIGCATMGIFSIYLAVFNYLADIYHKYASSALAAQSWARNMAAGAFPVFTAIMFRKMTYQGAASFLGAVAAILTIVPWALVLYGPRIRARSKIASELLKDRTID